ADGRLQAQIEEAFPYEETPDQAQAIVDTKADMERPIPMDRLVCGDVGYGKTEVALRAAAKAVFDGKQVAILVPTTLLASQHGQTFRELLREGQALYVHNRVKDIEHVAADVRELVPEARVAVAHGQMDEGRLERIVQEFWDHEYDVLVCTTIVESGLDMPTVNTLVVDRSDLLGLAQLYQLRGRVGRRGQRAYAYLFHPTDHKLSEEAYERLKTIGEFTDLGSGFKIAMRDLEMRCAGSLLGAEQSGHIAAVGFDLHAEMVTEAV